MEEETKALFDKPRDVQNNEYKLLLIANESSDAELTLYIYPVWAQFCLVSMESKIIKPNTKCLYRNLSKFKFKLVAKFYDNRKMRKLLEPRKWIKDNLIKIDKSLECITEDLANEEKRICLRKLHREKELENTGDQHNLYDILGLDMEEVRKMENDDLKKSIEKGFRQQMIIWHPDKNFGDDEIAKQINEARKILLDDEKRSRYHNEADYNRGWLSPKRYKAIFWPECCSDEQNQAYWSRLMKIAVTFSITIFGIVLSISTGSVGSILGAGLTAGGLQSLELVLNKDFIVNECGWKALLSKAAIGFVGGAITGGVAAGITAGIANLGSSALTSAATIMGGYVGLGSLTGALGGITSSLASDATRKFVDNDDVTARQVICRTICGAVIGATAGALGGLVTQSVINHQALSAASKSLELEIGKQLAIQGVSKSVSDELALDVSREFTESATKALMGRATQFVEERLDEKMENQHPMKHVGNGVKDVITCGITTVIKEGSAAVVSKAKTENNVKWNEEEYNPMSVGSNCNANADKEQNDSIINVQNGEPSASFEPNNNNNAFKRSRRLDNATSNEKETDEEKQSKTFQQSDNVQQLYGENSIEFQQCDGTDKIPQELHPSKIISEIGFGANEKIEDHDSDEVVVGFKPGQDTVTFYFKNKKCQQERSSESNNILSVDMGKVADKLQQSFHPLSNETSDEAENYELISKTWEQSENEGDEQVTIKYISEIHGVTEMIVAYCLNSDERKIKVRGSGKKVTVPSEATKVEVRFKVRRFIWWDIFKYDRFEKTWCNPPEPHIFRYERPRNRTFTISGDVFGAVTRVSDGHHDETKDM